MYTLTPEQNWQLQLNRRLSALATDITLQLEARWDTLGVVDRFLLTLFNKIHRSFQSIQLLAEHSFIEDALCVLRIMVEATINFTYGVKTDPVATWRRYWDWAVLDAVRRDRANNFHRNTPLYSRAREEGLLKAEEEIRSRYTAEDFGSLKRGVFGVSVEERARQADLLDYYHQLYRLTSRNVHAMDIAEMRTAREYFGDEAGFDRFVEARVNVLLSVSRKFLGMLSIWMDKAYSCGKADALTALNEEELKGGPTAPL